MDNLEQDTEPSTAHADAGVWDRIEQELRQWRQAPPSWVELRKLKTAPSLQPRDTRVTRTRDATRVAAMSEQHVDYLRGQLDADPLGELTPLLVANIDGALFVVDGHHRLNAYRRAGRQQAHACVRAMTWQHASLLAQWVNTDDIKLPMDNEQRSESAWKFLTHVTDRGRFTLPQLGLSLRRVGLKFGRDKDTIRNMMEAMERTKEAVAAGAFHADWLDPVLQWPRWKDARQPNGRQWDDVPASAHDAHLRAKLRTAIAHLQETYGREAFEEELAALAREDAGEATDDL